MNTREDPRRLTGPELHARFNHFMESDAHADGVAEFELVCRANPRWGLAYDLLGRLREAVGDDDGAYDAYHTGMEIGLRSRKMSRELKTDLVVKVVEFCVARGWRDRAATHIDTMERLAPRHPLIARLRNSDGPEEIRTLERHLDQRQEAQALVHQARDSYLRGDYDGARGLYLRAIEVDDRCTNAYIFLARAATHLPQAAVEETIAYFERLVGDRPSWGLGFNLLGQLYEAADDDDAAYDAFNRGADLSDTSPTLDRRRKADLRAALVRFCEARHWTDRAEQQRTRLRDLDHRHPLLTGDGVTIPEDAALAPARQAAHTGRPLVAARLYHQIIERDPRNRLAHAELAHVYTTMDPPDQKRGITFFEQLVQRSPRWGLAWRLLGELRAAHGDDEAAYAARHRATELGLASPNLPQSVKIANLLELVDFCNRRRWYERALIHVDAVLALDPDDPAGRALRDLLGERAG